ncbi:unannotated protein [freshwater metagenome]|uniref:Unannotated protein n=1 Tax=freshwater metagenome TaxID=449393 RepID=A0A6J7HQL5_9ZZZZ
MCKAIAQRSVKPGEAIAGATISFVASRPAIEVPFGRVRALVDNTQKQPSYRGVNFRAAHPRLPLRVITRLEDGITAGGDSLLKLQIADKSTAFKVHGVKVLGTLPEGITSGAIRENGWTCKAGDNVSCKYAPVLEKSARTPVVTIPLLASVDAQPGLRSILWTASGIRPNFATGSVRARLAVFPGAVLKAEAVPNVIGQRAVGDRASRVILRAVNSTRGSRVWTHRWEQMCLTQDERDVLEQCRGVRTEAVKVMSPNREIASVLIPVNVGDKSYVFRVRASDSHSHFDKFVKVQAAGATNRARAHRLPQVDARTGFAPTADFGSTREPVAPTMATANLIAVTSVTPVVANPTTQTPVTSTPRNSNLGVSIAGGALQIVRNGAKVTLDTAVSNASGKVTYAWQQIVGVAPALSSTSVAKPTFTVPNNTRVITYQVTVTDGSGATAIDTVTYALNPTVTTQFCSLYNKAAAAVNKAAQGAAKLSTALSDQINAVFNQLRMINDVCNSDSGFTFSGTNLSFGGFKISGASGTVSAAGIAISAGSLTSPAGWGLPEMNLSNAGLVIAFVGTTTADVTMSGSFTMSNFAFFPLPGGWTGKTKVSFVASAGNTSVAIAANSSDPGGATATFSGNVSTNGSFNATVTANDLIKIGGAGVNATGSVAYSTTNGITGSVTGSLTSTATLVDGVTIPTLNISWKPGASPAIAARGTVAFEYGSSGNSISVNATIAYTSTTEWTATVTGGGTATWQPVPGLTIQPSDFTGTFASVKGELQWALDVNVSQAWSPTPALTISGLDISLANSCPKAIADQVTCPTANVFLSVTGNATVNAEPVDSFTVDALAVIGLGDGGGFVLSAAQAGNLDIGAGLALTDANLVVSYQAPQAGSGPAVSASVQGGYSIDVNGNMVISGVGNFSHLQANVTSDGWSFAGYTQGIPFGSSGEYGEMTQSIVAYSTLPSTITPPTSYGIPPLTYVECQGNQPAPTGQVCTGTLYVSGTYAAPTWFTDAVDTDSMDAVATIEINPTDGTFNSQVNFNIGGGGLSLPTGGSSDLAIQSLYFSLNASAANLVVTAGGLINLGLPSGYGAAPPQLNLFMQYDLSSNTVSGGFTATNWNDAFGLSGFDMQSLTVALQINLNTMTPGLALSATADLPESMNSVLSVPDSGVPITAFVNLSLNTPCLGVSIGTQGANEPTALSIAGGVVTASYVSLYIAPVGCQIGNTTYQPGYSLDFDGTVLGVGVEVSASMSFTPTLVFQADIDIKSFQVGPLTMDETTLSINVSEGVSDSVAFSGGFSLFGTDVTASGSMSYVTATSTTTAALDIATNGFDIAGFQLQNADISLNVKSTPDDTNISFSATASMAILGDTLDINEMSFTVENNVITQVTADVSTKLQLGGAIEFDGAFYLNYTASPANFEVAANVNVTSAGYTLGSGSLSISPSCADVSATLNVGSFLSASVGGYVIYGADCTVTDAITGVTRSISGDSGAFCVAVDNVSLDFGAFNASGSANLSNNGDTTCDGTSTASNTMVGSVSATLVLGAQNFNNTVNVAGQFSGDGNFSFTGSAALNIGGFNLQMQVAAANNGSGSSVSGSANFSLLGNDLTFAGSWSNQGGVPSATLTASVNFNLGGWNLGSGSVYLYQTASNYGMTFNMNLNAGIAQMQSTLTFNQVDGQVLFYTFVSFDLGIPGFASVGASGSFTNCATSACQSLGNYVLTASASLSLGGWTYYTPPFSIDLGGQFGFSVSDGQSNQSTPVVNVLGVNWWTANGWWNTSLSVNQDGFSASAGGGTSIYSQLVSVKYPCGPWYWVFKDWCSYGVTDWGSIGAKASINPWAFCFQVFGSPWICL